MSSRPRPDEQAVRDQLREERAEVEGEAPAGTNGAAGEASAAPDADAAANAEGESPAAERTDAEPEPGSLEFVTRQRDEFLDLARRTQADFENYRKRTAKDVAAAGSRARVGLIREVLPVVDNLERALSSATDADHGLVEGVRLVHSELQGVLQRAGVETIEPAGEQFDPNVHEALSMRPEDGAESGVVLDVVEKGYRTADQVIRPARVVVAA